VTCYCPFDAEQEPEALHLIAQDSQAHHGLLSVRLPAIKQTSLLVKKKLMRKSLDEENIPIAWVDVDVPSDGLWGTILECLHKASDQSF